MAMAAPANFGVSLQTLLRGLDVDVPEVDCTVTGLTLDSSRVQPGDLFLALEGQRVHGLDYVDEALSRGAIAVLYQPTMRRPAGPVRDVPFIPLADLPRHVSVIAARFFGEPARDLTVIGVTGTNGKTTCSHLLAQTLADGERGCGLLGTLGYGVLPNLDEGVHTTPDAIGVQSWLARFRQQRLQFVAMEVSSHALAQQRVAAVPFDTAVFTNLSRDHLDYHEHMDAYFLAKRRLFEREGLRIAVINGQDPRAGDIRQVLPSTCRCVYFGTGSRPTLPSGVDYVWAEHVAPSSMGLDVKGVSSWGAFDLRVPLVGRFNAMNVVAVLAVLLTQDVSLDQALARLEGVAPAPGRMERHGGGDRPQVIVDYAHTPDALRQALQASRDHAAGTLRCVFGCGGDRDRGKRAEMGRIAAELANELVITDDNPRNESPERIVADICAGVVAGSLVAVEHDRRLAIHRAIEGSAVGDVILVAGKGHENYQLVGDQRMEFSDAAVVEAALRGWRP